MLFRSGNGSVGCAAPTPEAVAAALLAEFTPAERADLAAFLDRLFVEGAGACRRAWRKSGSNVFFLCSADLVGFLRLIRAGL